MGDCNWLDEILAEIVPTCPQPQKQNWGQNKQAEILMDKGYSYSVPSVPSVPTKNDRFEKKTTDSLDFKLEERRNKVLAMLADNPGIQMAYITDTQSDPDNVILTIAMRDQYTFEMEIKKDKYDPFSLLEILNKEPQGE